MKTFVVITSFRFLSSLAKLLTLYPALGLYLTLLKAHVGFECSLLNLIHI